MHTLHLSNRNNNAIASQSHNDMYLGIYIHGSAHEWAMKSRSRRTQTFDKGLGDKLTNTISVHSQITIHTLGTHGMSDCN